jgi:hypothetical protein
VESLGRFLPSVSHRLKVLLRRTLPTADKIGASCLRYRVMSGRLQALRVRSPGGGGLSLQLLLVSNSGAGQSQQKKQAPSGAVRFRRSEWG